MSSAMDRVNTERGKMGAHQNRIKIAIDNLTQARQNYLSAESRIKDADITEESAQVVRGKILQQTAAAVLAQANQAPSLALKLLGGQG